MTTGTSSALAAYLAELKAALVESVRGSSAAPRVELTCDLRMRDVVALQ